MEPVQRLTFKVLGDDAIPLSQSSRWEKACRSMLITVSHPRGNIRGMFLSADLDLVSAQLIDFGRSNVRRGNSLAGKRGPHKTSTRQGGIQKMDNSDGIKELVQAQFAGSAQQFVESKLHRQGDDLQRMVDLAELSGHERVLDIATGADIPHLRLRVMFAKWSRPI